ncbi:MAG: hypothetical protein R3A78_08125 [Polyangiales bacterium]|nr:hypothetical protein [Myxococcales bacterium]
MPYASRSRQPFTAVVAALVLTSGFGCGGGDEETFVGVNGDNSMLPGADGGTGSGNDSPNSAGLAVLGNGTHAPDAVVLTRVGSSADGLNNPRDVAVNPAAPEQVWVINHNDHSATIFLDAATPQQTSMKRNGPGSSHFMSKPAAIAFGAPGILATAQEEDAPTQPTTPADFMGPTMFSADLAIFDGGHASHLDMLHNSPNSVGIEWDHNNVYWVFDGLHASVTRYDFQKDHGLAGEDHSDGIVARYVEGQVGYVPGVGSHLALDHGTGRLYVADSGNNRIAVLDTNSGTRGANIAPNYDGSDQYSMEGASFTTLVDGAAVGLVRPSGIVLVGDTLFVTDHGATRIVAFDRSGAILDWLGVESVVQAGGLMGIDAAPDGSLYVVDATGNALIRVSAKAP